MLVARRQSDLLVLLSNFTRRSDELLAFEVKVPDYERNQDAASYSERGEKCKTRHRSFFFEWVGENQGMVLLSCVSSRKS